ncbi:MAG: hypothetical protein AB1714_30140 [Acidobacteriota bacterium]
MLTNELLEMKYRVQRSFAEQGGDDLRLYAQNVHRIVQDVERKHGLKFRYEQVKKRTRSHNTPTSSGSHETAA